MTVNPFLLGVLTTLFVEAIALIIFAIIASFRDKDKKGE